MSLLIFHHTWCFPLVIFSTLFHCVFFGYNFTRCTFSYQPWFVLGPCGFPSWLYLVVYLIVVCITCNFAIACLRFWCVFQDVWSANSCKDYGILEIHSSTKNCCVYLTDQEHVSPWLITQHNFDFSVCHMRISSHRVTENTGLLPSHLSWELTAVTSHNFCLFHWASQQVWNFIPLENTSKP
jgi:hypothetical protein